MSKPEEVANDIAARIEQQGCVTAGCPKNAMCCTDCLRDAIAQIIADAFKGEREEHRAKLAEGRADFHELRKVYSEVKIGKDRLEAKHAALLAIAERLAEATRDTCTCSIGIELTCPSCRKSEEALSEFNKFKEKQ